MPASSILARLQQLIVLAVVACAGAWLLWMWPRSAAVAVMGALALLLGHTWFLAVEFWLLSRVVRDDSVPRASAGERWRAWGAETVHALRVFGWRQPFRWRAIPDQLGGANVRGRTGVVLIHGFVCNRGFWTPWMRALRAQGRAFVAVNLEPVFGEIDAYVPLVERAVREVRQATGRAPVLVGHSMGGLVARAWLRTQPSADAVAHVVTIGTPHAGTWLAQWSWLPNGRQMRRDAAWLQALDRAWTPQLARRFTCWWSNCDNVVLPASAARLPGADNRLVRGAGHVELAFRAQVMQASLALLDAPGPPLTRDVMGG